MMQHSLHGPAGSASGRTHRRAPADGMWSCRASAAPTISHPPMQPAIPALLCREQPSRVSLRCCASSAREASSERVVPARRQLRTHSICKALRDTQDSSVRTEDSPSLHSQPSSSSSESQGSTTAQREQERELQALQTIPAKEQGYEMLAAWVGAAMAFGGGIWYLQGPEKAQEYFAGYLLEQSLSVDNLFVFILVFNYFKTPQAAQKKVLTWGIATAAVLRAVFIVAGVEMIELFQPLLIFFAAILIYSSYKILAGGDDDDDDEDLTDNAVVKFCRRFIPTSSEYDGDRFWTTATATAATTTTTTSGNGSSSSNGSSAPPAPGSTIATPLLLTLAVVELSDVLFAVDSIPAVFGVTLDPFIIYSSNIFAILSLRALYSFVSNVMSELRFLDKSVALVLGFIGLKMLLGFGDVEIPTDVSLLVVGLVLGGGVAASLLLPEPADSD